MARLRLGPARIPSRESPEAAVELLLEHGYDACEIDFESGFWMDYPWAERLGEVAREHDVALSVHAPLFGFMGHLEASGRKFSSAVGRARPQRGHRGRVRRRAPVVFHPGFLLGRSGRLRWTPSSSSSAALRERLEGKGRAVPFGVEVMGRVRDLGSLADVVEISRRTGWVRPVLDFAHMHATSDGAYLEPGLFAEALEAVDAVLEPGAPFHIHFSDIAYANRNETKHLSYGEGTLRAEPLREALRRFDRPATVISESPDEASTQAIRAILAALGGAALPASGDSRHRPRRRGRVRAGTAASASAARSDARRNSVGRRISTASRKSRSASSSRPWAARTSPSAPRSSRASWRLPGRRSRAPRARTAPPRRSGPGRAEPARAAAGSRPASAVPERLQNPDRVAQKLLGARARSPFCQATIAEPVQRLARVCRAAPPPRRARAPPSRAASASSSRPSIVACRPARA